MQNACRRWPRLHPSKQPRERRGIAQEERSDPTASRREGCGRWEEATDKVDGHLGALFPERYLDSASAAKSVLQAQWRVDTSQRAARHDSNTSADGLGFIHCVRRQHNASTRLRLRDQPPHLPTGLGVETRRWLVEKHLRGESSNPSHWCGTMRARGAPVGRGDNGCGLVVGRGRGRERLATSLQSGDGSKAGRQWLQSYSPPSYSAAHQGGCGPRASRQRKRWPARRASSSLLRAVQPGDAARDRALRPGCGPRRVPTACCGGRP